MTDHSPALPERTRPQQSYVAWLIECRTAHGAQWLVSTIGEAKWTTDALEAFQFETEKAAHHEINRRGGHMAFTPSGLIARPTDHQFIVVRPDDPPQCPAQWGSRRCVDVAGHEGIHYAADGADWMDEPPPHPLRFPGVAREAFLRRFAEKWRREYQAGVDTPEVLQIAEVVDAVLRYDE